MFNDTVTIYNKYSDGNIEKWQRTVLTGVFWDSSKGAILRKTGASSDDGLMLLMPRDVNATGKYLKPKEWAALADKSECWTLQSGDSVILGDIDHEIVKSSKELQQFDNLITISLVDTKGFGDDMAHWEVSGK